MAEPVPEGVRERLLKLCGMLGSAHEGERNAALIQVNRLMAEHRLTWADVLAPPQLPAVRVTVGDAEPEAPPARDAAGNLIAPSWRHAVFYIRHNRADVLRGNRELEFLMSIERSTRQALSEAQEKWLRDIGLRAAVTWL